MGGGRQWARADATRQALLSAALRVFADRGYSAAGIAEIVERSGISVGSLYHHYGGKAGLYVALWEDLSAEQEASAAQAVSAARKEGESDPIALFTAGAGPTCGCAGSGGRRPGSSSTARARRGRR